MSASKKSSQPAKYNATKGAQPHNADRDMVDGAEDIIDQTDTEHAEAELGVQETNMVKTEHTEAESVPTKFAPVEIVTTDMMDGSDSAIDQLNSETNLIKTEHIESENDTATDKMQGNTEQTQLDDLEMDENTVTSSRHSEEVLALVTDEHFPGESSTDDIDSSGHDNCNEAKDEAVDNLVSSNNYVGIDTDLHLSETQEQGYDKVMANDSLLTQQARPDTDSSDRSECEPGHERQEVVEDNQTENADEISSVKLEGDNLGDSKMAGLALDKLRLSDAAEFSGKSSTDETYVAIQSV